jgi:S1-C subfamily serine protease
VAAITAAMLAAAFVGVGIGRAVNQNRTIAATSTPLQQVPAIPGFPGLGSGSGSGSGSSGSGSGSGSGASGSNSAAVANVEAGVVDINTSLGYQSASAAGTGMVITSSGEVLTNNHVINGATRITATLVTTGKTYTAKVVGTDVTGDVALLQLEGASGLKTVPLGDSSTVSSGASVIAIGNAGGVGGAPSVVDGTVQATGQTITASDQGGANAERLSNLIETNAPIQPGDSGGPLVDANGKVIGMDTAASSGNRFQASADVAFAIPINDAMSVIHQIESGQASSTIHLGLPGFLGVGQDSNGGVLGGRGSSGATVDTVVSGSPAANAGIHQGDTITALNGQSIGSWQDLTTQLQLSHPGQSVTIGWTDSSGSQHTATVKLITGPAS